ncbi:MAG: flavodoxin-dependent (E)-4-hydroxy-3-methylbut-2-enyl-diphosphate synthase, partial [Enterobacteriaceae bacterium]
QSGFYIDGVRQKERLANEEMIDQLEAKIRARAAMLDQTNRIDHKTVSDTDC